MIPPLWASLVAQLKRLHLLQCRRCGFDTWVGKIPCRRKWQPTPVFLPGKSHRQRSLAVPGSSAGKDSACNSGNSGSILGSRRSPGERISCKVQYSWASLVTQNVKNPPAI